MASSYLLKKLITSPSFTTFHFRTVATPSFRTTRQLTRSILPFSSPAVVGASFSRFVGRKDFHVHVSDEDYGAFFKTPFSYLVVTCLFYKIMPVLFVMCYLMIHGLLWSKHRIRISTFVRVLRPFYTCVFNYLLTMKGKLSFCNTHKCRYLQVRVYIIAKIKVGYAYNTWKSVKLVIIP